MDENKPSPRYVPTAIDSTPRLTDADDTLDLKPYEFPYKATVPESFALSIQTAVNNLILESTRRIEDVARSMKPGEMLASLLVHNDWAKSKMEASTITHQILRFSRALNPGERHDAEQLYRAEHGDRFVSINWFERKADEE